MVYDEREEVLASLEASDPDIDWAHRRGYNMDRMIVHGRRRRDRNGGGGNHGS
jgi:hypothetical protein